VSLDAADDEEEEQQFEVDQAAEVELRDATIKLVRLLANLCIDPSTGLSVGSRHDNIQVRATVVR
jgi:hypothetical protein